MRLSVILKDLNDKGKLVYLFAKCISIFRLKYNNYDT